MSAVSIPESYSTAKGEVADHASASRGMQRSLRCRTAALSRALKPFCSTSCTPLPPSLAQIPEDDQRRCQHSFCDENLYVYHERRKNIAFYMRFMCHQIDVPNDVNKGFNALLFFWVPVVGSIHLVVIKPRSLCPELLVPPHFDCLTNYFHRALFRTYLAKGGSLPFIRPTFKTRPQARRGAEDRSIL